MSVWKRYLILTCSCLGIGVITGSLFRGSYFNELKGIIDGFQGDVMNRLLYMGNKENTLLLIRVLFTRFIPFVLMWLLAKTVAKTPYFLWVCISRGFWIGCWCCFLAMAYGTASIRLIHMWYFPQLLFYFVVYGGSLWYITEGIKKRKVIIITLLTILLLTGCLLETYVNPTCLSWAITL